MLIAEGRFHSRRFVKLVDWHASDEFSMDVEVVSIEVSVDFDVCLTFEHWATRKKQNVRVC